MEPDSKAPIPSHPRHRIPGPTWLIPILLIAGIVVTPARAQNDTRPPGMDAVPIADCHVHLLDFLQNGGYLEDGREVTPGAGNALPSGHRHLRLDLLLHKMNESNISHAVIMGMPFVKKWSAGDAFRSTYYLNSSSRVVRARDTDYVIALAVEDFRRADPKRFAQEFPKLYPFICGFDGTDLGAVDMIVKRIKEFPGTWKGIGEVMSRHDDLTNLTTGARPRANHPSLFRIYDFAGMHGLPVSLHHNVAPVSHDGRDPKTRYLTEILQAFAAFPKTNFIWCHAGISRRIVVNDLVEILDQQVLAPHGNHVCIDLSWVVYEDYVLGRIKGGISRDEQRRRIVRPKWVELIEKYPDNFVLGSDKVGDFRRYRREIRKYNDLLRALSPTTRRKVACENFLRIAPKLGLSLPRDYMYPEARFTGVRQPIK